MAMPQPVSLQVGTSAPAPLRPCLLSVFFSPLCAASCQLSGAWSDNVLAVHPLLSLGWVGQGSADTLHGSIWVSALYSFLFRSSFRGRSCVTSVGHTVFGQPLSCSPRASPPAMRGVHPYACACWRGSCHSAGVLHEKSGTWHFLPLEFQYLKWV